MRSTSLCVGSFLAALIACAGCGDSTEDPAVFGSGEEGVDGGGSVQFDEAGAVGLDGSTTIPFGGDPKNCEEAAAFKTYLGCDFWPTIVPNFVWSSFDYTVVVANDSDASAEVKVTGPLGTNKSVTVAPKSLEKIFLPWVPALKDPASAGESQYKLTQSIKVEKSAYHLTSSVPVSAYQFNPLEYVAKGGAPGKTWTCRGGDPNLSNCLSYSNDATLLLPSTAMTGTYRVTGFDLGGNLTITGTADNTLVKVRVGPEANKVQSGAGIAETPANGIVSFTLNAGDVATLASWGSMGGSLVSADKAVQAISSNVCSWTTSGACDHMEETILPAETLGKHYVVSTPSGAAGPSVGHLVYFFGNVDGTTLTYLPSKPTGCPSTLNAGQVARCDLTGVGVGVAYSPSGAFNTDAQNLVVSQSFEVTGSHEFAVSMFLQGAISADPVGAKGDPSQTSAVAVEQFRDNYSFLTPNDYTDSYVDVVAPPGTQLTLDGVAVTATGTTISPNYEVVRVKLGSTAEEAHSLKGNHPFGVQVVGYGKATSYQYPGGLNLGRISAPPPPVN